MLDLLDHALTGFAIGFGAVLALAMLGGILLFLVDRRSRP